MSIEVTTRVWKNSLEKGSALLLLLALADNADDDGYCWPGEDHLAGKIRMGKRNTQLLLGLLDEHGEIYRRLGLGRGNTTEYLVVSNLDETEIAYKLKRKFGLSEKDANLTSFQIMERRKLCTLSREKVKNPAGKGEKSSDETWPDSPRPQTVNGAEVQSTIIIEPSDPDPSDSLGNNLPSLKIKVLHMEGQPEEPPSKVPAKVSPVRPIVHKTKSSETKPESALTKAMHEATPEDIRPVRCHYAKHSVPAKALHNGGITPEQVSAYVKWRYENDQWMWRGDDGTPVVITMSMIEQRIKSWLSSQKGIGSNGNGASPSGQSAATSNVQGNAGNAGLLEKAGADRAPTWLNQGRTRAGVPNLPGNESNNDGRSG